MANCTRLRLVQFLPFSLQHSWNLSQISLLAMLLHIQISLLKNEITKSKLNIGSEGESQNLTTRYISQVHYVQYTTVHYKGGKITAPKYEHFSDTDFRGTHTCPHLGQGHYNWTFCPTNTRFARMIMSQHNVAISAFCSENDHCPTVIYSSVG